MKIPVLFVFFVKDTAMEVFEVIRRNKPPRLYLASDGPRRDSATDAERIAVLRKRILAGVDWPCEVKTFFRDENAGCRLNMVSSIGWFFEHEEMGIILEDDVLPVDSAFPYCEELLTRYRDEKKIGTVSCLNPVSKWTAGEQESYFFSRYTITNGWATWRDRWEKYDVTMSDWPLWRDSGGLAKFFQHSKAAERYWRLLFNHIYAKDRDNWDIQWGFLHMRQGWLSAIPMRNQVNNIGFNSADAVNTTNPPPAFMTESIPMQLTFPLKHPRSLEPREDFDHRIQEDCYASTPLKVAAFQLKSWLTKIPFFDGLGLYKKFRSMYFRFR